MKAYIQKCILPIWSIMAENRGSVKFKITFLILIRIWRSDTHSNANRELKRSKSIAHSVTERNKKFYDTGNNIYFG